VLYLEDEEIEAMDKEDDDFQTVNESEIGAEDIHAYHEGQILNQELIQDDSVAKFDLHQDAVICVEPAPREPFNVFVSGGMDDKAFVWRLVKEEHADEEAKNEELKAENKTGISVRSILVKALDGHSETVEFAKFSFDGKLLATAGMNNAIRVWTTETFELKHAITEGAVQQDINFLEWHPKGNVFVTGGQDFVIWLYNGVNGAVLQCLVGHEDQVLSAKFTIADGGKNVVSSGADKTIRIWNPMQN